MLIYELGLVLPSFVLCFFSKSKFTVICNELQEIITIIKISCIGTDKNKILLKREKRKNIFDLII